MSGLGWSPALYRYMRETSQVLLDGENESAKTQNTKFEGGPSGRAVKSAVVHLTAVTGVGSSPALAT